MLARPDPGNMAPSLHFCFTAIITPSAPPRAARTSFGGVLLPHFRLIHHAPWHAVRIVRLCNVGIVPAVFQSSAGCPASEILMHRIVWSLGFLAIVLAWRKQWSWIAGVLRQPKVLAGFTASALLLSTNWFIYIWAVNNGRVVDASLGYFINPLVSVLLGSLLLHERLRPGQWALLPWPAQAWHG
jgi:uncharacterized membrane protein